MIFIFYYFFISFFIIFYSERPCFAASPFRPGLPCKQTAGLSSRRLLLQRHNSASVPHSCSKADARH